ncbi:MAG: 2-amino-4-hydroxy-6-hydroxymethyldihydropteridine pyrophosphokinae [Segetibacter sp.]|nr:2-amino-4-hydroxy-6-hydroxymethyldihydropteridine pyrophosphokinae [Segetibacter sp.]
MNNIFLLTGGNIGDRLKYLHHAWEMVEKQVGPVLKKSSVYETSAWGVTDQSPFLNQVLLVETKLPAAIILETILNIEQALGRKRTEKMGPRTIDIDMLFFNNETISSPNLTVPHPQIQNRRFVLTPLYEIAPGFIHPVLQKTIGELLEICPDRLEVKLLPMMEG